MKIVGFDPGFTSVGIAIVDSETMNCEVLKAFKTKKADKKAIKSLRVADDDVRRLNEIIGFIRENLPDPKEQFIVAAESFSNRGKFIKDKDGGKGKLIMFKSGYKAALGYSAMITLANVYEAEILIFIPQDIKKCLCGTITASKQEVWEKAFKEFDIDISAYNKGDLEHIGDALTLTILAKREQEKIERIIGRR